MLQQVVPVAVMETAISPFKEDFAGVEGAELRALESLACTFSMNGGGDLLSEGFLYAGARRAVVSSVLFAIAGSQSYAGFFQILSLSLSLNS